MVKYKYIEPSYEQVKIKISSDTISFSINEDFYNEIKSFNFFYQGDKEYLAFYDDRSYSVNIYDFKSRNLIKNISVKKLLGKHELYKTTVYCESLDSIFVTNKNSLYLFDSSGLIKLKIRFLETPPLAWAHFENICPAILKNGYLFMGVRPYVKENSFKALRDWKVLYEFNLNNKKANLYYNLPELYQNNIFDSKLLNYNYCFNNKEKFVFSFPADTNIYETNLRKYHIGYYAKSKFQNAPIQPIRGRQQFSQAENRSDQYSYGAIYFDSFNRRYLRIAKCKVFSNDEKSKYLQRVIVFDDKFKIIGESDVDNSVLLNSILVARDGKIYARVNASDEYALNFVQLTYVNQSYKSIEIVKK